jgi:hypothetical protein
MLKLFLLALIVVVFAIIALSVRIIFKKDGKFVNTHISENKELRKKGIKCATQDEYNCESCSCSID